MRTESQNRREFIASTARTAMLGSIGALGTFLIVRKKICLNRGVCRSCNAYAKCELPQKEKLR